MGKSFINQMLPVLSYEFKVTVEISFQASEASRG